MLLVGYVDSDGKMASVIHFRPKNRSTYLTFEKQRELLAIVGQVRRRDQF